MCLVDLIVFFDEGRAADVTSIDCSNTVNTDSVVSLHFSQGDTGCVRTTGYMKPGWTTELKGFEIHLVARYE